MISGLYNVTAGSNVLSFIAIIDKSDPIWGAAMALLYVSICMSVFKYIWVYVCIYKCCFYHLPNPYLSWWFMRALWRRSRTDLMSGFPWIPLISSIDTNLVLGIFNRGSPTWRISSCSVVEPPPIKPGEKTFDDDDDEVMEDEEEEEEEEAANPNTWSQQITRINISICSFYPCLMRSKFEPPPR